ncbi:MAG: S41 family peptidase [Flavobacterium sp.]|uniref:S41 family peptidase n=1 Tax=Flavobacterium sp. TaxID=239 RepID=UPI003BA78736
MKKSYLLSILFLSFTMMIFAQKKPAKSVFNFDFETIENGHPKGWNSYGSETYRNVLDSTVVKSGKYSVSLAYQEGSQNFKALAFTLPNNYKGKLITLSGFIKTEDVSEGHAGLWMQIDPSLGFDNMNNRGIIGTKDWTKYEIKLPLHPDKTEKIYVGGLLIGKGKMWLDDLKVTIDGKEIQNLKPYLKTVFPAQLDKEFDEGSKISSFDYTSSQIANLKMLGLIWGFLKYHHPKVASGDLNWDYELFRIMPKIISAKSTSERDAIFTAWITSLGEFKTTSLKEPKDKIKFKPDLDWITTSNFSNELTTALNKVKTAKRTDNHYYLAFYPYVNNPDFKNENAYAKMVYPDTGFRLLTLFRYWNMIQYYFPYKNLIEEDWKMVLEEFIPKFLQAKDEIEYTLTTLEIIARIHDTHANIWGGNAVLNKFYGSKFGVAEIKFIEDKAVVTRFYDDKLGEESGLKVGDIIASVNQKPIEEFVKDKLPRTPASNYPTQLRDIANLVLRTNDDELSIEYIRDGKKSQRKIATYTTDKIDIYKFYQDLNPSFKFVEKDIAYINLGTVKKDNLPELWEQFKNSKGLILDIRNYPSDHNAMYILGSYLVHKKSKFVKFTKGSLKHPGMFSFYTSYNVPNKKDKNYQGKVVILVNEITQSRAEFHAMAYQQSPNAIVMGSTTAGADGNVSIISLPGGISTMISGIGIYYPDGRETQRIGIVPDIEVKPTIEGVKMGRDEVLEKAIEYINKD